MTTIAIERNGKAVEVTVTEPTPAIIAMAQRMAADPSNMVDGTINADGTVVLDARGARGSMLSEWAHTAIEKLAAKPAPVRSATIGSSDHGWTCRRCHGPVSVHGSDICDFCEEMGS